MADSVDRWVEAGNQAYEERRTRVSRGDGARCICDETHCVVGCKVCDELAAHDGDCPTSGAPL